MLILRHNSFTVSIKSYIIILFAFFLGLYVFSTKSNNNPNLNNKIKETNLINVPKAFKIKNTVLLAKDKGSLSHKVPEEQAHGSKQTLGADKKIINDTKRATKKFDPNLEVKFEVIDGYAVAAEDILLGRPKNKNLRAQQTLYTNEIKTWLNAEVPIAFDNNLPSALKSRIENALNEFELKTSIRFLPYSGYEKDFIVFSYSKDLCASYIGRNGGPQPILINSKCQSSDIKHEVMHALGFIHEHQRVVRDQFLKVFYENIQKEKVINFDILPEPFQRVYKDIYEGIDFKSILIYPSKAFVTDKSLNSIISLPSEGLILENEDLSAGDIEKIDKLYFRKF